MIQTHTFEPICDSTSRILILGTLPSVTSRADGFYYGHPRNRFWPLLARLFGEETPETQEEKTEMLLRNHVALWDVVKVCEIEGSDDASIRKAQPNDISRILDACPIQSIYANGQTAAKLYRRLVLPVTGREAVALPSTSPANAAWTMERLLEAWKVIVE